MKNKLSLLVYLFFIFLLSGCLDSETGVTYESIVGTWEVEKVAGDEKEAFPEPFLNTTITFHRDGKVVVNALEQDGDEIKKFQNTQNYKIKNDSLFIIFPDEQRPGTFRFENGKLVLEDPILNTTMYFTKVEN